jgi:hypothetical protein
MSIARIDVDVVVETDARQHQIQLLETALERARRGELGVAFYMKQLGSRAVDRGMPINYTGKGDDPAEWPEELRVREFPA